MNKEKILTILCTGIILMQEMFNDKETRKDLSGQKVPSMHQTKSPVVLPLPL